VQAPADREQQAGEKMVGKVIVYGGRGGLGVVVVDHFKSLDYWVLSVDVVANEAADANVLVDLGVGWAEQEQGVCQGVGAALGGGGVEAVINMAGGWAGGNASNADWVKNADLMWKQSVWSSAISATLSARHLCPGGLLVLPGAKPCVGGTPGMMGYGMAKAAVHQLVKSCAAEGSGLPAGACTLGLLPVTLDTPMNRKFMPDADKSSWTPLSEVASILADWAAGKGRLESGSLVALITTQGTTRLEPC